MFLICRQLLVENSIYCIDPGTYLSKTYPVAGDVDIFSYQYEVQDLSSTTNINSLCMLWPSQDVLLKHDIQLEKTPFWPWSIMADIYSQIFTYHSTENKWIIVSQKGLIYNLIVIPYQKYVDVCHVSIKVIKLLLEKKIQIFKVKEMFCHNFKALFMI